MLLPLLYVFLVPFFALRGNNSLAAIIEYTLIITSEAFDVNGDFYVNK